MQKNKEARLAKELVKIYQKLDKEIQVSWNTMTRDEPVYFDEEEELLDKYPSPKMKKTLKYWSDKIERNLHLSEEDECEYIREGRGKVFLNTKEELVLKYASQEYLYSHEYWFGIRDSDPDRIEASGYEFTTLPKFQLKAHNELNKQFHRLELIFEGIMDKDFNIQTSIGIKTIQGDVYSLTLETEEFYKTQLKQYLENLIPGLESSRKPFRSLHIDGQLDPSHCVQFRATKNGFSFLKLYNNQTLILSSCLSKI